MSNYDQSFKVHRDYSQHSQQNLQVSEHSSTLTDSQQSIGSSSHPVIPASIPTSYLIASPTPSEKDLPPFRKPLTIRNSAHNMSINISIEEMFAKANIAEQSTSSISDSGSIGVFQFTKLPNEIKAGIIEEYIHMCCPNLSVLEKEGKISVTQDLNQQAKPSHLLDHTIAQELEASLYPSLLVSKGWYIMVAGYMIRNMVYIDGYFNLQRLLLFQKRCHGFGFDISMEEPVVDKPTSIYTFGVKYYFPGPVREDPNGWATDEIAGKPYWFDWHGEGPWWKRPIFYDSDTPMSDICHALEEPEAEDWFSIPDWVRGGSLHIGGHLNYDDCSIDGSINSSTDNPTDSSNIDFGSIVDDPSSESKSIENGDDAGMDSVLDEYSEPGSFLARAKTLILGPGASRIHKSDVAHWVSSVDRREVSHDPQENPKIAIYYCLPATHLLHRMLGRSGEPSSVEKLIISGHIWANPWLFMPRPVESDLRFSNLTSLTLALPFESPEEASPMRSLRYFEARCADRHLCMLLTGRFEVGGKVSKVIEEGSTFLNTLEYLHIRGPGAHCCSELFEARWKKLESVIIELPTTAAICEPDAENLIKTVETKFLHRLPKAKVQIQLRTILPGNDSNLERYFWRLLEQNFPSTLTYPGEARSLSHAREGVDLTFFNRQTEESAIDRAHEDWTAAINNMQHEEQLFVNRAVEYFMLRDGIDIRTMVWNHDHIWRAAENQATNFAIAEESVIAEESAIAAGTAGRNPVMDDEEESDYTALRLAADDEYNRQNQEYAEHILAVSKQGFTPQRSGIFI